jgi:hypothetical protein
MWHVSYGSPRYLRCGEASVRICRFSNNSIADVEPTMGRWHG